MLTTSLELLYGGSVTIIAGIGSGKKLQLIRLIICSAKALLSAVFILFSIVFNAQAATTVAGQIATDTSWTLAESPYQVTDDVTVSSGAVLTIEPGVIVRFDANKNLIISSGALVAAGSESQPITLTSSLDGEPNTASAGDWGQLRFLNGTDDSATYLQYLNMRYGKGISVTSASPTFNYINITHTDGAAISIDLNSSPKGVGNQASENTINGISVPAGEVANNVTWAIKGIPYVVATGELFVGAAPTITTVSPVEVQQGLSVDAMITGTRLSGIDAIKFDNPDLTGTLTNTGNGVEVAVQITAAETIPVGTAVPFEVRTAAGWVRFENGINVIAVKPTITLDSIAPNTIRRKETKAIVLTGSQLNGAVINAPSGFSISNLQTTDTEATFDLSINEVAALGEQQITAQNLSVANGTASIGLTVVEALPEVDISSIPLTVLPDNITREFDITLTNADNVDHILNFSIADESIITVTPASVTVPAGETKATISLTGVQLGATSLNISSTTLADVSKQIYATNLQDGLEVDPLLSSVINVEVAEPAGSNISTISSVITVETSSPEGDPEAPVLSSLIRVNAPAPLGVEEPLFSSSINVNVQTTEDFGPVVSPAITVEVAIE